MSKIMILLQNALQRLIYYVPVMLTALTVHEYCHAKTAQLLGDNTAKYAGRVSLNPLRHLDPIGAVCMVIFGFGWGKPVPISVLNFKKPQRDSALVALAGPLSNLLMACIWGFAYGIFGALFLKENYAITLCFYGVYLNCVLCVFNLLPITPLDGSRILSLILPKNVYFKLIKYERIFFIIVIILMFTNVLNPVISYLAKGVMTGIDYTFVNLGWHLGNFFR